MTYFIVEAPYEQCFDLFFKDECGYPNFYRLNELLPTHEQYAQLILLAPDPKIGQPHLHKISERLGERKVKCLSFGESLPTQFTFEPSGKLRTHPLFQEALDKAVQQFLAASTS